MYVEEITSARTAQDWKIKTGRPQITDTFFKKFMMIHRNQKSEK